MAGWRRIFSRKTGAQTKERDYQVAFKLYSVDGKRCAEVRVRRDGQAYFVEREWVEGTTFTDRRHGEEIGPFETPETAEFAAITRPWFRGDTLN